jgi:hypothetical protein
MGMALDLHLVRITDLITKHPLSMPFRTPVDIPKLAIENYRAVCPDPMDLSTVSKKLKSQQYPSLKAWSSDMNLIFYNAIRYNGPASVIGGMALYLKGQVDKRVQALLCNNVRNYEARVIQLTRAVRELLDSPPHQCGVAPIETETLPLLEDFSAQRIETLLTKLNAGVRAGRLQEIEAVLERAGERVFTRDNSELDLAGISRRALHALERYVKVQEW